MTNEEIFNSFKRIRFWQSGSQRAPHKPLLILYVLAELVQRKASQSVSGGSSRGEWVLRLHGEALGSPQSTDYVARPEYLKWHWEEEEEEEVFRAAARERTGFEEGGQPSIDACQSNEPLLWILTARAFSYPSFVAMHAFEVRRQTLASGGCLVALPIQDRLPVWPPV